METFSALLAICAGIHRSPVNSPHKGQWCGTLMFSLICVWINSWVNDREAGDLRRLRGHYDVIVMIKSNPSISLHPEEARTWCAKSWSKTNSMKIQILEFVQKLNTWHNVWCRLIRCVNIKYIWLVFWMIQNEHNSIYRSTDEWTDGWTEWKQYPPSTSLAEV